MYKRHRKSAKNVTHKVSMQRAKTTSPDESFPYDVPQDADLTINTQIHNVEEGVQQVLQLLREREII